MRNTNKKKGRKGPEGEGEGGEGREGEGGEGREGEGGGSWSMLLTYTLAHTTRPHTSRLLTENRRGGELSGRGGREGREGEGWGREEKTLKKNPLCN